jgi:hypothetical protein
MGSSPTDGRCDILRVSAIQPTPLIESHQLEFIDRADMTANDSPVNPFASYFEELTAIP